MNNSITQLTSGRVLVRNTIINLAGQGLPLVAAIFSTPLIIRGLGTDRFGLLTIAWITIGYFSLFDVGLGRALTKLVAELLGNEKHDEIPPLVWTALALMLALGVVGGLLLFLISPWLSQDFLKLSTSLQSEAKQTFYMLAFAIPFVTVTGGLAGILSARQQFGMLNAVRLPLGLLMYLGPLLILPFSNTLPLVMGVLLGGRVLSTLIHLALCLYVMPALRHHLIFDWRVVGRLSRFGGWMTVSNIISPLMLIVDRFLIGALVSITAVAYYATPYDAVTRLLIVPSGITAVMFPAFAMTFARDQARAARLFNRCLAYVGAVLFPITLIIIALSSEGLTLWVGGEFAHHSSIVLQWLMLGVFLNGLAYIPFSFIQGAGRPDITAKIHMAELPIYLLSLWVLTVNYGIEGAAVAWTARMAIDCLLLFIMTQRLMPGRFSIRSQPMLVIGLALVISICSMLLPNTTDRVLFIVATFGLFLAGGVTLLISHHASSVANVTQSDNLTPGGSSVIGGK
jgi:O-antigen/teichoic acid export membrane protein